MRVLMLVLFVLAARSVDAQQIDLKPLDVLVTRATERVEINMDESMLKSATGVLSGSLSGDADGRAATRKVIEGLKGIYGRVLEFADAYDRRPVDEFRRQLRSPQWTNMVRLADGAEVLEVWLHRTAGAMDGMLLLAAESKELVVVNLIGMTTLDDLAKIGGQFGLPQIGVTMK